jgi:amidase
MFYLKLFPSFTFVLIVLLSVPSRADSPDIINMNVGELVEAIKTQRITSEEVVAIYLKRITQHDDKLNSIISVNPNALNEARQKDLQVKAGQAVGSLHGIPVLVKDNIETKELPTTAGSIALLENDTERDASIIARLRKQGAIILGKTNLSEWANFRSTDSISGWSGVGGQTHNPHSLDRSACGSSAGSGAAIAAQFAPLAIGTETNGSIICPSSMNGVVGFKPTVGLMSRHRIVPISVTQDTAGPMTRSVYDAALMLTTMAGSDVNDAATKLADSKKVDFTRALNGNIKGLRIGVARWSQGDRPAILSAFNEAVATFERLGAVLVDINEYQREDGYSAHSRWVTRTEFKQELNAYLATSSSKVKHRTLEALIEFNKNDERELVLYDQSRFLQSQATIGYDDPKYQEALKVVRRVTRGEGIDYLSERYDVEVIIMPARPAAFMIDAVYGDDYPGGSVGVNWMAAVSGYPIISVPMGDEQGLPLGLGIMGGAWDDETVLRVGYAYEQASHKILQPTFVKSAGDNPRVADALAPYKG